MIALNASSAPPIRFVIDTLPIDVRLESNAECGTHAGTFRQPEQRQPLSVRCSMPSWRRWQESAEIPLPACPAQASLLKIPQRSPNCQAAVIIPDHVGDFNQPQAQNSLLPNSATYQAKTHMNASNSVAEVVRTFGHPKPKNNETLDGVSANAFYCLAVANSIHTLHWQLRPCDKRPLQINGAVNTECKSAREK